MVVGNPRKSRMMMMGGGYRYKDMPIECTMYKYGVELSVQVIDVKVGFIDVKEYYTQGELTDVYL